MCILFIKMQPIHFLIPIPCEDDLNAITAKRWRTNRYDLKGHKVECRGGKRFEIIGNW